MEELGEQSKTKTYENYCFTCGHYSQIDEYTKMCVPCAEDWAKKARTTIQQAILNNVHVNLQPI